MYYFGREPGVTRAVFIGTPHRGSDMSPSAIGRLAAALAGVPRELMHTTAEVMKLNPHLRSRDCRLATSVELLAPGAPSLQVLAERGRPDGVAYHSVVGVALAKPTWVQSCFGGDGRSGDGVVLYGSAHLDESNSELVVQSDHYRLHHHPLAVRELRRILLEHIDQAQRKARPSP
jgi:hypothetical protein